jgi:hypothetical protein
MTKNCVCPLFEAYNLIVCDMCIVTVGAVAHHALHVNLWVERQDVFDGADILTI